MGDRKPLCRYGGLFSGRGMLRKTTLRDGDLKINSLKATCAVLPLENLHVPLITSVSLKSHTLTLGLPLEV